MADDSFQSILSKYAHEPADGAPQAFERSTQKPFFEPFAKGFAEGAVDAVTLGLVDLPGEPEGAAGTAGEIAGMIVGEIPFWLIGGGVAKQLVGRSVRLAKLAAAAPRAFPAVGQAAGAVGIDVGRSVIGGDEDALSPLRLGIDVSVPFAASLLKKPLTRAAKEVSPSTSTFGPNLTAAQKQGASNLEKVSQGMTKNDALRARGYDTTFMTFVDDSSRVDAVMNLWRQGAPLDDLVRLHSAQEVIDYSRRMTTTGVNIKKGLRESWSAEAKTRSTVSESNMRMWLSGMRRETQEEFGVASERRSREILASRVEKAAPFQNTTLLADDLVNVTRRGITAPSFGAGKVSLHGITKTVPRENVARMQRLGLFDSPTVIPAREPTNVPDLGILEQRMFKWFAAPHGASMSDPDIAFDSLTKVPRIDPPLDVQGKVQRAFVDRMALWPVVNKGIVSSVRAVEAMGESGRQIGGLLRQMHWWTARTTGGAHADMANAFKGMKTNDQFVMFIRALDEGETAADEAVEIAAGAFRKHQKYLENMFIDQGVKVKMANGDSVPMIDVIKAHFFPHKHDWDFVLKDTDLTEAAAKKIEAHLGGIYVGMKSKKLLELYVKKEQSMRMPRFSSLFERNVNLPGWLGDPKFAAKRGDAYQTDVQDVVMEFFEDAFSMAGANRHLGAPKGYNWMDDTALLTDLSPIHSAIKKRIEATSFTIARRMEAGKAIDPTHSVTKISAFRDPIGVERAAAKGDELAQGMLDQAQAGLVHPDVPTSTPWKVANLLGGIEKEGMDSEVARELVASVVGARYYNRKDVNFSRVMRNFNILTKLGVVATENVGQVGFTITKTGFRNTSTALYQFFANKSMAIDEVMRMGALGEDAIRALEGEAGRSFTSSFLKKIGFTASERMLRTVSALSGKYHVEDLFQRLTRVPSNVAQRHQWNTSVRLLKKYGFNMGEVVKDGALTPKGIDITNALAGGGDEALATAVRQLGGFEAARQTQFLSRVMDNPIAAASPYGKIFFQFKKFITDSTKFVMRDVLDEAAHFNFVPLVRLVMSGIAIGEVTQNARAFVSGQDPAERGQAGLVRDSFIPTIRELFGESVPDDDQARLEYLGKRWSTNDTAARLIENVLGMGYGGVFFSMLQSAQQRGVASLLGFAAGPTIQTAVDVGQGVVDLATEGKPQQLGRQALRAVGGPLGALVPGKGAIQAVAAFGGASLGRQAQLALLPTEGQKSRSLYVTPDETREIAANSVTRRYNSVRQHAKDAVLRGDRDEAMRVVRVWNGQARSELDDLMRLDALNYGVVQKMTFDSDDIQRLMASTEEPEGTAFARVGGAVGRVGEIATSQPFPSAVR